MSVFLCWKTFRANFPSNNWCRRHISWIWENFIFELQISTKIGTQREDQRMSYYFHSIRDKTTQIFKSLCFGLRDFGHLLLWLVRRNLQVSHTFKESNNFNVISRLRLDISYFDHMLDSWKLSNASLQAHTILVEEYILAWKILDIYPLCSKTVDSSSILATMKTQFSHIFDAKISISCISEISPIQPTSSKFLNERDTFQRRSHFGFGDFGHLPLSFNNRKLQHSFG